MGKVMNDATGILDMQASTDIQKDTDIRKDYQYRVTADVRAPTRLPRDVNMIHEAYLKEKEDSKFPHHGIVGSIFYSEDHNSLSSRRCAWLRKEIILYHAARANNEISSENGTEAVEYFWETILKRCNENHQ